MTSLSEHAKILKSYLVMMEKQPIEFGKTPLCRDKVLVKLITDASQLEMVRDLSPRERVKKALQWMAISYIVDDISRSEPDYEALLGLLFVWGMYLDLAGYGKYRKITLEDIVDHYCNDRIVVDFIDNQVEPYAEQFETKDAINKIKEFTESGITSLLGIILPNKQQKRANQLRKLDNYLNNAIQRIVVDIERAAPEVFEQANSAIQESIEGFLDINSFIVSLQELGRRSTAKICRTVVARTVEINSGKVHIEWNEALDVLRSTSGILVGLPHTGMTTYAMMIVRESQKSNDILAVYVSAPDLKKYALTRSSAYEYIANELILEKLADVTVYERIIELLRQLDYSGRLLFIIDDLDDVDVKIQDEIVVQFALCKHVFFVSTPWASERRVKLMKSFNADLSPQTVSLCHLTRNEQLELLELFLGKEEFKNFLSAMPDFPEKNFCGLAFYPIGISAMAADYLENKKSYELSTVVRVFNTLLKDVGLESYQIGIEHLPDGKYKFHPLGVALAFRKPDSSSREHRWLGDSEDLFWDMSVLEKIFRTDVSGMRAFIHQFLEPNKSESMVRFIFPDFHYLILAIYYVRPDKRATYFGAAFADVIISPLKENCGPFMNPDLIVLLYQRDINISLYSYELLDNNIDNQNKNNVEGVYSVE